MMSLGEVLMVILSRAEVNDSFVKAIASLGGWLSAEEACRKYIRP